MRMRAIVGALLVGGCAAVTFALSQTYTQTTRTESRPVIVGEVVRYEPGQVIVIRSAADNKEVSYTLTRSLTVPSGVKIGSNVNLYFDPADKTVVKRVTINTTTSAG